MDRSSFWDRLATISLAELRAVRRWLDGEFERRLSSLDALEKQKTALDQQGATQRSLRVQRALARQIADLDHQAALEARLLQLVGKQQQVLDRLIWSRESVDRWESLRAVAPAAVALDWEDLVGAAEQAASAEAHLDELLRILGVPEAEWPQADGLVYRQEPAVSRQPVREGLVLVTEVLDGQTVRLATGALVRYIGVDAPLLDGPLGGPDPGAREAWEANRQLAEGRHARLEADALDRDRDGTLWRYVWVRDRCANAELIRQGYTYHQPRSPNYRHSEWFAQLEREARRKKRGMWR